MSAAPFFHFFFVWIQTQTCLRSHFSDIPISGESMRFLGLLRVFYSCRIHSEFLMVMVRKRDVRVGSELDDVRLVPQYAKHYYGKCNEYI